MAYLKTAQLCCENLGGANDSWRHVMWLAHSAGRSGVAGMIVPAPHCFPSRSSASILPHLSLEKKNRFLLSSEKKDQSWCFLLLLNSFISLHLPGLKVICVTSHGLNISRSTLIVVRQLLFVMSTMCSKSWKMWENGPKWEWKSLRGIPWIL